MLESAALTEKYMSPKRAGWLFIAFAFAYALSYAYRTVGAIIASPLQTELNLSASELGLLTSAYFFSFALMQLPLGALLDRFGPKRVEAALLLLAVIGSGLFAAADSYQGLWLGRALIGVGVSACLMASYKAFSQWCPPTWQASLSSWMLMAGSLGAVATTMPAQWVLDWIGWRAMFYGMSLLTLLSIVWLWVGVPASKIPANAVTIGWRAQWTVYKEIFGHKAFKCVALIGLVQQGGIMALQGLWIAPWLLRVEGYDAAQTAKTLFALLVLSTLAYLALGVLTAKWFKTRVALDRLMVAGIVIYLLALLGVVIGSGGVWSLLGLGIAFIALSTGTLSYARVSAAFPPERNGRASTSYNFLIFAGAFVLQWGIGLLIDLGQSLGLSLVLAMRVAFFALIVLQGMALLVFVKDR